MYQNVCGKSKTRINNILKCICSDYLYKLMLVCLKHHGISKTTSKVIRLGWEGLLRKGRRKGMNQQRSNPCTSRSSLIRVSWKSARTALLCSLFRLETTILHRTFKNDNNPPLENVERTSRRRRNRSRIREITFR